LRRSGLTNATKTRDDFDAPSAPASAGGTKRIGGPGEGPNLALGAMYIDAVRLNSNLGGRVLDAENDCG